MTKEPWWFEDFSPGTRFVTEGATITESSILDFAFRFDPQPFHLDVEAAKETIYGGLIASGFQTLIMAFRLWQGMRVMNPSSQGSPGMDELRWLAPVRPGDTIHVEAEVLEARPSGSRPQLGIVAFDFVVLTHRGVKAMSWKSTGLHLRRPENRPPETLEA